MNEYIELFMVPKYSLTAKNRLYNKIDLSFFNRVSLFEMKFVQPTDTGYYECRAMNVVAREPAIGRTRVIVSPTPMVWNTTIKNTVDRGTTTISTQTASTAWHAKGRPCPIATFCLNGGTCSFHENVGEHVCL